VVGARTIGTHCGSTWRESACAASSSTLAIKCVRSGLLAVADQIEEGLVDARVVGEFGMEGRGHDSSLPNGYRVVALSSDDFDSRPDALDLWSADENHFQWRIFCRRSWHLVVGHFVLKKFAFADGAVDLASVGVAADADVECGEAFLFGILYFVRKQDRSRAGAERGFHSDKLFQLFEPGSAQQIEEGSGFAPRNHQAVDLVELLGLLDEHNLGIQLFKPAAVRVEITLQGQDTDFHAGLILPEWIKIKIRVRLSLLAKRTIADVFTGASLCHDDSSRTSVY
jgi:hypothetical protein